MSTLKVAVMNFLVQDAAEIDNHVDIDDVFSGTSATRADDSCAEQMFRLVGQVGTALVLLGTIATYLNW